MMSPQLMRSRPIIFTLIALFVLSISQLIHAAPPTCTATSTRLSCTVSVTGKCLITALPATTTSSNNQTAAPFTYTSIHNVGTGPVILSPLHPNTQYKVSVTPYTDAGFATDSESADFTTLAASPRILSFTATGPASGAGDHWNGATVFYLTFDSAVDPDQISIAGWNPAIGDIGTPTKARINDRTVSLVYNPFGNLPGFHDGTIINLYSVIVTYNGNTLISPSLTGYLGLNQGAQYSFSFTDGYGDTNIANATVPTQIVDVSGQSAVLSMVQLNVNYAYLTVRTSRPSEVSVYPDALRDIAVRNGVGSITVVRSSPDFIGQVAVRYTVGGSSTAAEQQATLIVNFIALNTPPAINVVDGALNVIYGEHSYIGGSFEIVDAQSSAGDTTLLFMTITASPGATLSWDTQQSAPTCIPTCNTTEVGSFLIEASMVDLRTTLANMRILPRFPDDVSQPLSLTISLDDRSNGGKAPSNFITSRTIPINVRCHVQQYVGRVSAALTPTLNSIRVTLDTAVDPVFVSKLAVDCGTILTAETLLMFRSATCRFANPKELVIVFGRDSSWTRDQQITVWHQGLPVCSSFDSDAQPNIYPGLVVADAGTVAPQMSLVAPQSLPFCSNCTSANDYVVLTAVTLTNLALLPSITWVLPPSNFNSTGVIGINSQQLRVPLSAFQAEATFPFSFTITYLGSSSAGASQDIQVQSSQPLALLPENSAVTNMIESQPLSLGVSVWFGSNVPRSQQSGAGLTFAWSVPGVGGDKMAGETSPNLYVKPQSLAVGNHTITVSCTSNGQTITHSFTVMVAGDGLYAVINGGDVHGISVSNALTLDGSLSYDLQSSGSSSYIWQCKDMFGAACVNRARGGTVSLQSASSSVALDSGSLFPGMYIVTLTFSNAGRSSSASVRVQVYSSWAPEVLISTVPITSVVPSSSAIVQDSNTGAVHRVAGARIINSGDQLTLYGAVVGSDIIILTNTSALPNANNTLFAWTITGGPNVLPPAGMIGANRPLLVVNSLNTEGFFVPGYTYIITLTVSNLINGAVVSSGQSSVVYYVNRPPICSAFDVNLSEGEAFDLENSVFKYSFQVYDPDEDQQLSSMTYQMYRIDLASGLDYDLTSEMSLVQGSLGALTTGNPDNNFHLTLGLRAWDRFRATSLTPIDIISKPASEFVTINQLVNYYIASDAVTRADSQALMAATANVISALSSRYVDYVADASSLPNYDAFQRQFAATKKYLVLRVLEPSFVESVRASILVDFLAIAMSDYTTLDRSTIATIIKTLKDLMIASDNELWDDITGDSHVLASTTYVLQQAFHACSLDINNLVQPEVSNYTGLGARLISPPQLANPETSPSSRDLFSRTEDSVQILLSHLKENVPLSGDVVGLNFNRSLSGMVSKLMPADNVNISASFPSTYWSTEVTISPSAFSLSGSDTLEVSLLQIDGWGDKISFDIFPTIYVDIAQTDADGSYRSYTAGTVNIAVTYEGRACFDGWVNSGKFRFNADPEPGTCTLHCGKYNPTTQDFVIDDSLFVSWDKLENVFTCTVPGPGYYTVMKDNAAVQPLAKDGDGVVYASIRIVGPRDFNSSLFVEDLSYLLDVPSNRIDIFQINDVVANQTTSEVFFKILSSSSSSPLDSFTLAAAYGNQSMLVTSHTAVLRHSIAKSKTCYMNPDYTDPQEIGMCKPHFDHSGLSKNEIITIGVVVGFFGTFIVAALLFCCGKTIKYWWDRHDFQSANAEDDEDVDVHEVSEMAEMSKIGLNEQSINQSSRRGNKVSWYNGSTREIDDASNYTYSRNSSASRVSVSADSRGRPSFRVSGDQLDGEQVDDIQVIGGDDGEIDASELAEIAVVLDESSQLGGEDEVHYMDGKKVKKVQQLVSFDADSGIDDSAMSRSRASSLNSNSGFEYSQNSQNSSLHFSDNEESTNELSRNRANTKDDYRRQYYK